MKSIVLNHSSSPDGSMSGDDLSPELKSKMDSLKMAFFDLEKGGVDYENMKGSDAFEVYKGAAERLAFFALDGLTKRESRLAFWINIYNVLVVHGILALNIRKSVKEVSSFFQTVSYNVGGHVFSLDDIEHGILRGNKKRHILFRKPFRGHDERKRFGLERVDPRIHFALVCGSNSCPPIDVYEESRIDEQLDLVSEAFINSDEVMIDKAKNRLRLSRIFKWYGDDFGGKKGVPAFLARYRFDPEEKAFLERDAGGLGISYHDYDWSLNLA